MQLGKSDFQRNVRVEVQQLDTHRDTRSTNNVLQTHLFSRPNHCRGTSERFGSPDNQLDSSSIVLKRPVLIADLLKKNGKSIWIQVPLANCVLVVYCITRQIELAKWHVVLKLRLVRCTLQQSFGRTCLEYTTDNDR